MRTRSRRSVAASLSVGLSLAVLPVTAGLLSSSCREVAGQQRRPSDPEARTQSVTGVVSQDVLTAGRIVDVTADVRGDVAAAGGNVSINGPVQGYVMSAGRHVTVAGPVGNDLWAAGETVDVRNTVGNNAMLAGRTVELSPEGSIAGSARMAGERVVANGRVGGDLHIGATRAEIDGEVEGRVEAHAQQVSILPGAVLHGDLIVESPNPPDISPSATIAGEVRHDPTNTGGRWEYGPSWPLLWVFIAGALFLLGAAALAFAPAWAARVAATLRARVGWSALAGFLWLVLTPIVAGILAVTVFGIPLAIVLGALYVAVLLLSGVFVSYQVGTWVLARAGRPDASPWWRMLAGIVIVSLGISLPFVGWIVAIAVLLFGAGALLLERRGSRAPAAAAGVP